VFQEDKGIKKEFATLIAGDYFGEITLLTGKPDNFTYIAVMPCLLYKLQRKDLENIIAAHPSILTALQDTLSRRKPSLS
jgi:CPA1 family monovalent cation:H+ antiporter